VRTSWIVAGVAAVALAVAAGVGYQQWRGSGTPSTTTAGPASPAEDSAAPV